jgi:hypothetical protein
VAIKGGWCMVFKLHWMSILTRWCYKWTWKMYLTPCVRPFSRSFVWWEASCLCSSLLFFFFMPNCCLCFFNHHSPNPKSYWLSFHLWARVKVTYLLGPFLFLFIFMFYGPFLLFFLCDSSFCWKMTFTSSTQLPLFLFF